MPHSPSTTQTDDQANARSGVQGLTVERHFTETGVDPFSTVEWEMRAAEVGGFKQDDVEFPTTWSQNATNIVTQKYFRGRADSPERESSVKQMIGRVAGTIGSWGRELGYFASDADADAFQDELTWILLHQHASSSWNASASASDRKSTRLNSSHPSISYAVFCLKKKKT